MPRSRPAAPTGGVRHARGVLRRRARRPGGLAGLRRKRASTSAAAPASRQPLAEEGAAQPRRCPRAASAADAGRAASSPSPRRTSSRAASGTVAPAAAVERAPRPSPALRRAHVARAAAPWLGRLQLEHQRLVDQPRCELPAASRVTRAVGTDADDVRRSPRRARRPDLVQRAASTGEAAVEHAAAPRPGPARPRARAAGAAAIAPGARGRPRARIQTPPRPQYPPSRRSGPPRSACCGGLHPVGSQRQHLGAVLGHGHGVLEVAGELAVRLSPRSSRRGAPAPGARRR